MMSGTSLDGLDMALCHLWRENGAWDFEISHGTTIDYDEALLGKLKHAIHLSEEEHSQLHLDYGVWLGEQAKYFLETHGATIDFIASHGHTSHHRPEEGFTFQLGNGQQLANVCGKKVICDFRTLDVQLGGQGAPLVPIGDELLLSDYDFCLNLGGISNISFKKNGKRMAFDIGMANMPLNYITEKIGMKYDKGGKLAKNGKILPELLRNLNDLEYYKWPYPKSTGYEWFSSEVVPLLKKTEASTEDLLHTLIHHNCFQIAQIVKKENTNRKSQLLVTGGGALNDLFMTVLQEKLAPNCRLVVPKERFIEFKEALVFALMGVLKDLGETNILASVTGAKNDSSSGIVFFPEKS